MFVAAGPVSRILSAGLLRQDGHSSGPRITARLKRPTRRLWRAEPARASANPRLPPYLVLLRVGFALPAALLRRRCALTAPFHPYPALPPGGIFSVALSVEPGLNPDPPGRYPAHCSAEFGLSSPSLDAAERPSGPAANRFIIAIRASDLGRPSVRPRIYTDSHGSPFFSFLIVRL